VCPAGRRYQSIAAQPALSSIGGQMRALLHFLHTWKADDGLVCICDAACDSVELVDFVPGCVVVLSVRLSSAAVRLLDGLLRQFDQWVWAEQPCASRPYHILTEFEHAAVHEESDVSKSGGDDLDGGSTEVFLDLVRLVSGISRADAEHVMFQSETERHPSGDGYAVYHVPGHGDLPHCGLAGVASLLADMRRHGTEPSRCPLGINLLEGDWLMDYMVGRLAARPGAVHLLSTWFQHVFDLVKTLPRCLMPCYFEAIVSSVHLLVSSKMCDYSGSG